MNRSSLYTVCFFLLVGSFILYQFKGNPVKNKISQQVEMQEQIRNESSVLVADNDVVPTIQTAFTIAEPLLKEKYGEGEIEKEKPLSVALDKEVWVVTGSHGNIAEVQIDKITGEVLGLSINK